MGVTEKYRLPETDIFVSYAKYRRLTGECETCHEIMKGHLRCSACRILIGDGHFESRVFGRHEICGFCKLHKRHGKA